MLRDEKEKEYIGNIAGVQPVWLGLISRKKWIWIDNTSFNTKM